MRGRCGWIGGLGLWLAACGSDPAPLDSPDAGFSDSGFPDSGVVVNSAFEVEVIDVPALRGSVAVGSDGTPHIAFQSGQELRYGKKSGGSWSYETIAAVNPDSTAIAFDSTGAPIIATLDFDRQGDGKKHVRLLRQPDAWAPIDLGGGADPVHLVQRPDGVHVVSGSQYFRPNGGTFETITLATFATATTMTFDSQGRAHFLYADAPAKELIHQVRTGTTSTIDVVFDGSSPGGTIWTAQDGTITVAYEDDSVLTAAKLRVARWDGATWTAEEVGPGSSNSVPLAAAGPDGAIHLLQGRASYASNASGSWAREFLSFSSYSVVDIGLAVDGDSSPHLLLSAGQTLLYLTAK